MTWTLLTVYKSKGRDEPLAICDRCGRELYAAAYEVALIESNEAQIVGSGCCEILTGHTPARIAKNDQIREEARAAAEYELEWSLTVKRYKIANAQVIAFLERKKTEAQISSEAPPKKDGRYPYYNDFFESLLSHVERHSTLSEKQMAVVKRLMSRDESLPLPTVGNKIEASGPVIYSSVEIDPYSGYNRDSYLVKLDIDNGGQHVRVTIREGTKLWQNLNLNVSHDMTLRNVPKHLTVSGKVKYAKNGLVILTRAKLI